MFYWTVRIAYEGLVGKYLSDVQVLARTSQAAKKRAMQSIGNRDGQIVFVRKEMR